MVVHILSMRADLVLKSDASANCTEWHAMTCDRLSLHTETVIDVRQTARRASDDTGEQATKGRM